MFPAFQRAPGVADVSAAQVAGFEQLSRGWESQLEEFDFWLSPEQITGKLPLALRGTFFRNGVIHVHNHLIFASFAVLRIEPTSIAAFAVAAFAVAAYAVAAFAVAAFVVAAFAVAAFATVTLADPLVTTVRRSRID